MSSGNNKEICGNAINRARRMKRAARKGKLPLKISSIETSSPRVAFMAKMTMPKGGVMMPISIANTVTTPNQIRLKPNESTTGAMMGMVMSRIEVESRIVPRNNRMKMKSRTTTTAGTAILRMSSVI